MKDPTGVGSAAQTIALGGPSGTRHSGLRTMADVPTTIRLIRTRLPAVLLVAGMLLAPGMAAPRAQDWPTHPVKMIVPYGPGGITDIIARLVADRFAKAFGQPFVIDNRGGA